VKLRTTIVGLSICSYAFLSTQQVYAEDQTWRNGASDRAFLTATRNRLPTRKNYGYNVSI